MATDCNDERCIISCSCNTEKGWYEHTTVDQQVGQSMTLDPSTLTESANITYSTRATSTDDYYITATSKRAYADLGNKHLSCRKAVDCKYYGYVSSCSTGMVGTPVTVQTDGAALTCYKDCKDQYFTVTFKKTFNDNCAHGELAPGAGCSGLNNINIDGVVYNPSGYEYTTTAKSGAHVTWKETKDLTGSCNGGTLQTPDIDEIITSDRTFIANYDCENTCNYEYFLPAGGTELKAAPCGASCATGVCCNNADCKTALSGYPSLWVGAGTGGVEFGYCSGDNGLYSGYRVYNKISDTSNTCTRDGKTYYQTICSGTPKGHCYVGQKFVSNGCTSSRKRYYDGRGYFDIVGTEFGTCVCDPTQNYYDTESTCENKITDREHQYCENKAECYAFVDCGPGAYTTEEACEANKSKDEFICKKSSSTSCWSQTNPYFTLNVLSSRCKESISVQLIKVVSDKDTIVGEAVFRPNQSSASTQLTATGIPGSYKLLVCRNKTDNITHTTLAEVSHGSLYCFADQPDTLGVPSGCKKTQSTMPLCSYSEYRTFEAARTYSVTSYCN